MPESKKKKKAAKPNPVAAVPIGEPVCVAAFLRFRFS